MKKSLIIMFSILVFVACKTKNETKPGEETKSVEKTEGVVNEGNDSLNTGNSMDVSNSALQKNEDETYTFRYNLKKGETYPFELKISQDQNMSAGGQSMNTFTNRTVVFDYHVEDVKDNQYMIKATFKRFSESFKSPQVNLSYDTNSPKPTDKEVAQHWLIYKSLTGQDFELEMNNKGKILSVKNLDKVILNAMSQIKNDFTAEEQKGIKQMLDASLSKEAIVSQFEESLNIFPDKNLKVGEQWEDKQSINEGPMKGQNKLVRTFEKVENGVATISVKGGQDVKGSQTDPKSGITAEMKNHATMNGSIDLDYETGWIKKLKLTKNENITTTYSKDGKKESETASQKTITTVN